MDFEAQVTMLFTKAIKEHVGSLEADLIECRIRLGLFMTESARWTEENKALRERVEEQQRQISDLQGQLRPGHKTLANNKADARLKVSEEGSLAN